MRLSAAKTRAYVSILDGVDISIIGAVILFTSGWYKIPCSYPTLVGGESTWPIKPTIGRGKSGGSHRGL